MAQAAQPQKGPQENPEEKKDTQSRDELRARVDTSHMEKRADVKESNVEQRGDIKKELQDKTTKQEQQKEERAVSELEKELKKIAPETASEKSTPAPEQESKYAAIRYIDEKAETYLPERWSRNGKRLFVGATAGLGILGAWAWMRGKKAKEVGKEAAKNTKGGWFKKLMVGLGIGSLFALTGYAGYKFYKHGGDAIKAGNDMAKDLRDAGEKAKRIMKPAIDVGTGAVQQVTKTGQRIADVVEKDMHFGKEVLSKDKPGEWFRYLKQEGGFIAMENGALIAHIGKEVITMPLESMGKFKEWLRTNSMPDDAYIVYGAAGAAYFMGKGTLDLLLLGKLPLSTKIGKDVSVLRLVGRLGGKAALGPLNAAKDVLSVLNTARKSGGMEAMKLRYVGDAMLGKTAHFLEYVGGGTQAALNTEAGMAKAIETWKHLNRDVELMDNFKGALGLFSEGDVLKKVKAIKDQAEVIQKAASKLPASTGSKFLDTLKHISQLNRDTFTGELDKLWATEKAAVTATAKEAATVSRGSKVMKGLGVVGAIGADALDTGSYFLGEKPELQRKLATEKDPEKRAQLQREMNSREGEIVTGWASTTLLLPTAGKLIAGATPVGWAVMGAKEAGSFTRKSIEEGTSYMLDTNQKELLKYSSGNILWNIGRSSPISGVSWGQNLAATGANETFSDANEGVRYQNYRAYFEQVAMNCLDAITTLNDPEYAGLDEDAQRERLKAMQKDQIGQFSMIATQYIKYATGGTLELVAPTVLKQAELYAEYCVKRAQGTGRLEYATTKQQWAEASNIGTTLSDEVQTSMVKMLAECSNSPGQFKEQAPMHILSLLKHELADCEVRIRDTDFSNWKNLSSETTLKSVARGMFAHRIYKNLMTLIKKSDSTGIVTEQELIEAIGSMRQTLVIQDADKLAQEAMRDPLAEYWKLKGANEALLTPNGIREYMEKFSV